MCHIVILPREMLAAKPLAPLDAKNLPLLMKRKYSGFCDNVAGTYAMRCNM